MFNVCQGPSESFREYFTRFNETTIKVIHPNHKMCVGAFQNGLKVRNFNASFTQKPTTPMAEIMARAECYIKNEESNIGKKAIDVKERTFDASNTIITRGTHTSM